MKPVELIATVAVQAPEVPPIAVTCPTKPLIWLMPPTLSKPRYCCTAIRLVEAARADGHHRIGGLRDARDRIVSIQSIVDGHFGPMTVSVRPVCTGRIWGRMSQAVML